jgi:hypothetical protein
MGIWNSAVQSRDSMARFVVRNENFLIKQLQNWCKMIILNQCKIADFRYLEDFSMPQDELATCRE